MLTERSTPRVAIFVPSATGGGGEAVAREWAAYLADNTAGGRLYLYDDTSPDHATATAIRVRKGSLPRLLRLARAAANEIDADVVVGVLTYSNLVLAIARLFYHAPWRCVLTEHNVSTVLLREEGAAGRAKLWLARRLYPKAEAVVGVSHSVTTDLRVSFGVPAAKAFTICNPIPYATGQTIAPGPTGPLRVVAVGRLADQKRMDRFIDVIDVLRRHRSVEAAIIGDGPLRQQLAAYAKAKAVPVAFHGWCQPWWPAAAGAHVLLLTSSVEGFGNVLVEAADCGLASVVSAASLGSAEAVVPGVTGLLSLSDEPTMLAEAVEAAALLAPVTPPSGWRNQFTRAGSGEALLRVCRAVAAAVP